jgi:putative transposase
MNRAYKFRIYPNLKQQHQFYLEFAASKCVYNYYLDRTIKEYQQNKKTLNRNDWCKDLKFLNKTEEYSWIMGASSAVYRSTLYDDLDSAYKNFFRGIKNGKSIGFPKFKKFNSSVRYTNTSCKYSHQNHKVWFSKNGWIKIIDYKNAFGKLMNITVSKNKDGKWYASICVEQPDLKYENNSESKIGIDVGIKSFLVDSNGNKIDNPNFLNKQENKLKRLQRQLSKKKIGSNNRKKAKLKLAIAHEKISSQRKNFLNQNSTKLVKENIFIAHEDLNIKGMVKNHHLAKSISNVSWYEFFRMLEYKGKWYGCNIVKIGKFEPSSKTCNNCGYINNNLTLDIREWDCPDCGEHLDRDVNAARNILKLGLDKSTEV